MSLSASACLRRSCAKCARKGKNTRGKSKRGLLKVGGELFDFVKKKAII